MLRLCVLALALAMTGVFAQDQVPCSKLKGAWKVATLGANCEVMLDDHGKLLATGVANCDAKKGDVWVATCGKDDPNPQVREYLQSLGMLEVAVKFAPQSKP